MPRVEIRGLQGALDQLKNDIAKKASIRSINEITRKGKTAASRKIRDRYTIKARALNEKMRVETIRSQTGRALIRVVGDYFRIIDFARPSQTARGVTVRIRRGTPRELILHAFIARMMSGHEGVFARRWRWKTQPSAPMGTKTKGFAAMPKRFRLPVDERITIGPADMFDQQDVYTEVQYLVDTEYDLIFKRNYEFYSSR